MAFQSNILSQILQEVNRYDFKNEVSKYKGDFKTHKFSCFTILVVMVYAQLKAKKSLRDLVTSFSTLASGFFHHLGIKSISLSSLSDAINARPAKVFEDYYYQIYDTLNRQEKRQLKKKLLLIDSTTISLCIDTFNWAKYKSTKGGIKLHVVYDVEKATPEKVIISNARLHDIKGIRKQINFEQGSIYVYDRGYACYKYLYEIQRKNAYFVTRIKSNWTYDIIESRDVSPDTEVIADQIISTNGTKASDYPEDLRLISFYHKKNKKVLEFLTNNFELAAEEIADIYKTRWQIELFFKWIKQHLKVKSFFSTSSNGVKIQIWCALITYVLLQLLRIRLIIDIDLFEIFRRVQDSLDKRIDIFDLVTLRCSPPLKEENSGQLELNYA